MQTFGMTLVYDNGHAWGYNDRKICDCCKPGHTCKKQSKLAHSASGSKARIAFGAMIVIWRNVIVTAFAAGLKAHRLAFLLLPAALRLRKKICNY